MRMTEQQLRLVIREALLTEGPMADAFQTVGKYGSKVATVPLSLAAKIIGRVSSPSSSYKYERGVDKTAEGLENIVAKLLRLPGWGLDMSFSVFSNMIQSVGGDLSPQEKKKLYGEIDKEKRKRGKGRQEKPRKKPKPRSSKSMSLDESSDWYSEEHETIADRKFADNPASGNNEVHHSETGEALQRGDLYDMIRDFSKELTGRRNSYGSPVTLDPMSIQELADYYDSMFDFPEAADVIEKEQPSDIGELDPLVLPKQQGMGRRSS